ncbi:MAG TPA: tetratricopeptide repeat protein [Syntrophobacteraceae bacterium]|nr:tetratricopeptide repeat protein [Syntrophobacteraceae bacterium]
MANTTNNADDKLNLYIKFLKERLAFEPLSATLHYNLGLAFTHRGLVAEAVSEFKQAIECDPNLAEAYVNLGGLYADAEPAKSIEANMKALEINPDLGPAHSNLAFNYLRNSEPEKAVAHAKRALELMPGSPKAYQLLAAAYLESGRAEASAELSMRMIESDSSSAVAHFNLAVALRALGRDIEADEHALKAQQLGYRPL